MKAFLRIAVFLSSLGVGGLSWGGQLPDQLVKKLTAVIREHCPDAAFGQNGGFTAKHGTMMFTMHGRSKTGEVYEKTYQEEGPNFKGFLLTIAVVKDRYDGPLKIPQELGGIYFPTYFNVPMTEDGKNYYRIRFSYGSRLDPKLKQAIFDTLPGENPPMRSLDSAPAPTRGSQ